MSKAPTRVTTTTTMTPTTPKTTINKTRSTSSGWDHLQQKSNRQHQQQQQQHQQHWLQCLHRQQHEQLIQHTNDHHNHHHNDDHHRHYNRIHRMHLHLLQLHTKITIVIVFGLLLAIIRVSGQIDGYTAGEDYPAYETVPKGLSFKCQGRLPGYYADTETRCQVWHWCLHSGHQYSFLCPNGTVFNQAVRVCDWWSNVNCPASEQLYENNDELYRPTEQNQTENI